MSRGAVAGRPIALSRIAELLERDGRLVARPEADVEVTGIVDDSRRVRPGDLFCAWAGTEVDSHRFLSAAEAAGAVAALVERRVDDCALPQVVVEDGRRAAALAAGAVFGDPAAALHLVGVTGTNGKTTTVWLLRHLLGARWKTATIGTLGVIAEDGLPLPGSEALTTPGPVELARVLRELVDRGIEAVAMEVSSHALEQGRVHALDFDAAVFTNLSRDHLDYHGTEEAYRSAKLLLAGRLRPGGAAVINADDPAWKGLSESTERALEFSLKSGEADVHAEAVELGPFGARFRLAAGGDTQEVELPLLGAFNVYNALGAGAAALAVGLSLEEVAERLNTAPQVPGRLEKIADEPCAVLRDYAHTPDALERVLCALRPLVRGRLIVVFGAGGDRDRGKRPLMGEVAERWADLPIVTSDNPRTEDPELIIDEIVAGMSEGKHLRVTDRRAAIARALQVARPEDVIVLAGKGHETYQVLGRERVPFDERRIVSELVKARAGGVGA